MTGVNIMVKLRCRQSKLLIVLKQLSGELRIGLEDVTSLASKNKINTTLPKLTKFTFTA